MFIDPKDPASEPVAERIDFEIKHPKGIVSGYAVGEPFPMNLYFTVHSTMGIFSIKGHAFLDGTYTWGIVENLDYPRGLDIEIAVTIGREIEKHLQNR